MTQNEENPNLGQEEKTQIIAVPDSLGTDFSKMFGIRWILSTKSYNLMKRFPKLGNRSVKALIMPPALLPNKRPDWSREFSVPAMS